MGIDIGFHSLGSAFEPIAAGVARRGLRGAFLAFTLAFVTACPRSASEDPSEDPRTPPATQSDPRMVHGSDSPAPVLLRGPHAVRSISFYTEHNQFYVVDPDADFDTDPDSFWSPEAHERGMAVDPDGVGIGTASYGPIRAFFEVSESAPTMALDPWDRVVEGSMHVTSGRLVVADCTAFDIVAEAAVPPGDYRVRAYGAFLDDEIENTAGDEFHDFYWIVVWPAPRSEVVRLK